MICDQVPEGPGVYTFHGERGEILYIGKAVNLRQRMLSHMRQDPKPDEVRHSRLVYEVRDFDHQTTVSELPALLLEDELIKTHRPRFNIRQNEFLEYKYLELSADEYPRLRMIDHEADFGDRPVFGPYRDRYLVDRILQLIHQHIGLRSCPEPDPITSCLELDLGHCAGPCRKGVTPLDYQRVVARTVAFLDGDESDVALHLQQAMAHSAEKYEFEKAQRLKEHLEFCRRFGERQRFLHKFKERKLTVVEKGDHELTYVFLRGRLAAHGTAIELTECRSGGRTHIPSCSSNDARFLLDRATIVHNWLRRNSDRCEHTFAELDQ